MFDFFLLIRKKKLHLRFPTNDSDRASTRLPPPPPSSSAEAASWALPNGRKDTRYVRYTAMAKEKKDFSLIVDFVLYYCGISECVG